MLKWTINGSHRQSHLQNIKPINDSDHNHNDTIYRHHKNETRRSMSNIKPTCHVKREKMRRKSSGHELVNIHRKMLLSNKENNLTSTPLPLLKQSSSTTTLSVKSPLRKLDSLKDLSNITPSETYFDRSPVQTPNNKFISSFLTSIDGNSTMTNTISRNNPLQYATTLPTFDVEYSPCSVIPGPLLALRGVGIADSYFEKPRYLPQEFPVFRQRNDTQNPIESNNNNVTTNFTSTKRYNTDYDCKINSDNESLSSSRMGDTTLDKMIDAILESARKERRLPKSKQSQLHIMSPTYTPAEDPASDLNEFWDDRTSKYRQSETKIKNIDLGDPGGTIKTTTSTTTTNTTIATATKMFNEREVRTPDDYFIEQFPSSSIKQLVNVDKSDCFNKENISCHLRRQRAVRRKRKLSITSTNFIKSTVKQSAQKLFSNSSFARKIDSDRLADVQRHHIAKENYNNYSPDSGRNSASDLDDFNGEDSKDLKKRRLSFSPI